MDDSSDVLNWSEWLRENADKYISRFYLTLTGDADAVEDVTLKFSSLQAVKRTGDATFLSVVVPGFSAADSISARSNGDLILEIAYLVDGVESFREKIIEVDLETIRLDHGSRRRSVTLSGSRVIDYAENLVFLEDPTYKYVSNAKIRYRFLKVNPWVNPGDTVKCRDDQFRVASVNYTISNLFRQMEVVEA